MVAVQFLNFHTVCMHAHCKHFVKSDCILLYFKFFVPQEFFKHSAFYFDFSSVKLCVNTKFNFTNISAVWWSFSNSFTLHIFHRFKYYLMDKFFDKFVPCSDSQSRFSKLVIFTWKWLLLLELYSSQQWKHTWL